MKKILLLISIVFLCKNVLFAQACTNPTAKATANGPTTFCEGNGVLLTADSINGYTFQWKNNGVPIPNATRKTYNATASGAYSVTVSVTGGCQATSSALAVKVNPYPTSKIQAQSTTNICVGDSVELDANTGTELTYQWHLNSKDIKDATSSIYYAKRAGDYTVTVVNSNGCSLTSASITVTTKSTPDATITSNGKTNLCQGDSLIISAIKATGVTYQWKRLNNTTLTDETSSELKVKTQGNYYVEITNTSTSCVATSSVVNVKFNPIPPAVIGASGATTFCMGDSVVLSANSGKYSYQWRNNSVSLVHDTLKTLSAKISGTYDVIITSSGCTATSNQIKVSVNTLPLKPAISKTADTLVSTKANSYQWNLNKVAIPFATNQKLTVKVSGSYTVKITDANGCANTSDVYLYGVTGLSLESIQSISIYPNPAKDILNISINNLSKLKIINNLGIIVLSANIGEGQNILSLNALNPGIYYLVFESNDKTYRQTFVKE